MKRIVLSFFILVLLFCGCVFVDDENEEIVENSRVLQLSSFKIIV